MMPKNRSLSYDPSDSLLSALPERIPVMPIKSTVVFPTGATGLQLSFPPNVEVLSLNPGKTLVVALVATEEEDSPIAPATIEKVGVAARVLNRLNLPGGTIQATIQGLIRIHLESVRYEHGYYTAFPRLVEEVPTPEMEAEQTIERILTTLNGIGAKVERLAEVPRILRRNTGDPGRFADLVATLAHFSVQEKDAVLQRLDISDRLGFVLRRLDAEWRRVLTHEEEERSAPPASPAGQAARSTDRSGDLRRQIAALQAELGEIDPAEKEAIDPAAADRTGAAPDARGIHRTTGGGAAPRRLADLHGGDGDPHLPGGAAGDPLGPVRRRGHHRPRRPCARRWIRSTWGWRR